MRAPRLPAVISAAPPLGGGGARDIYREALRGLAIIARTGWWELERV